MLTTRTSLKLISAAIACLYTGFAYADDLTPFPFYPRLNVYGGTGSNSYGRADAMIPVFGSTDGIIYTDIDGQRGSNDNNYLSIGIGGRDAVNDDFLWGGYLFTDRITSNIDNITNKWTVFNPGIEYMTNIWDGRFNIYIPSATQQTTTSGLFGDQVGQSSAVSFSGHNQYSGLFDEVQEIGPGADVDFGLTINQWNRFRIHAGGYYFNPKDTDKVHGGEIGAEMPINNYFTLEAIDTYDNVQNNKALLTLRVTFGGADKSSSTPMVQDRLLDPVYHNFAGMAESTVVPIGNQAVLTEQTALERSNIWFFTANGGSAFNASNGTQNCTYESPCSGSSFTQTNAASINNIDPVTNFYFTPGSYALGGFTLFNGQSMYGRTNDYTLPAASGAGPIFTGMINPQGNNTFDSFTLVNSTGIYPAGFNIANAKNILINNVQVGQLNANQGYLNGVYINSGTNIMVQNSTINAISVGVSIQANSSVVLNNNTVNVNNLSITNGAIGFVSGPDNTVTATHNTFNMTSDDDAIGVISLGSNSTLNINENTFNINGSGSNDSYFGVSNAQGHINLTNNTFNITDTASLVPTIGVAGLLNVDNGTINASNNIFNLIALNQTTGMVYGVYNLLSGGNVTIDGNVFNINAAFDSVGIQNNTGSPSLVNAANNTFSFLSNTATQTCSNGGYTNNGGNIFNGC